MLGVFAVGVALLGGLVALRPTAVGAVPISTASLRQSISTSATTATTVSATFASTPVSGNLLVAVFQTRGNSATAVTTAPSGWTLAGTLNGVGTAPHLIQSIYYKTSAGTESGAVSLTWNGAPVSSGVSLFEYSGGTFAFDGYAAVTEGSTATTLASGSVSTTQSNDVILAAFTFADDATGAATVSSWTNSFSERFDFTVASPTTANIAGFSTADLLSNSAGSHSVSTTYAGSPTRSISQIVAFTFSIPTPPTITSVSSTSADGTYIAGQAVALDVEFSVAVTGSLTLNLNDGGTCSIATITSSSTATCVHSVVAGASMRELDVTSMSGSLYNGIGTAMVSFAPGTSFATNKDIFVDSVLPTLAVVTDVPALGNDNSPDFTFSSDEAGTLAVGGACSTTTTEVVVGDNTINLVAATGDFADGTYADCTVTVTDTVDNASAPLAIGGTSGFTVDTEKPEMSVQSPPSPSTVATSSVDVSVVVTDAHGLQTVQYRVGEGRDEDCDGTVDDVAVCHVPLVDQFDNLIVVSVRDLAGNLRESPTLHVTRDSLRPSVTSASPSAGSWVTSSSVDVTLYVYDEFSAISSVSLGGVTCEEAMTPSSFGFSGTAYLCPSVALSSEGDNHLARCTADSLGNSDCDDMVLKLDSVAPVVDSITPSEDSWVTATSVTLTVVAHDVTSGISSVSVRVGADGVDQDCDGPYDEDAHWVCTGTGIALDQDGAYDLVVSATDAAGLRESPTRRLYRDMAPPTGSITSPAAESSRNTRSFTMTGTCSDAMSSCTEVSFVIGESDTSACSVADGSWSCDVTLPDTDATHTVSACFRDAAGNSDCRSQSVSVTLDRESPTLGHVSSVRTPTNDTTPPVAISSSEAGTATSSCIDGSVAVVSGENTFDLMTEGQGTYECSVVVTDAAGNASDPLALNSFVLDTHAPSIWSVSSSSESGTYHLDDSLQVTLYFDEPVYVEVDGSPTVSLSSNEGAVATCGSRSLAEDRRSMTCDYTVGDGDYSLDLEALSLSLHGSLITDDAGNELPNGDGSVTLPATESSFSLADQNALAVDAIADIAVSVSNSAEGSISFVDGATFTITATNNGSRAATGVSVSLDRGETSSMACAPGTPSVGTYGGTDSYSTWTIGDLAVSASATMTMSCTFTSNAAGHTRYVSARRSAGSPVDRISSNDSDRSDVVIRELNPTATAPYFAPIYTTHSSLSGTSTSAAGSRVYVSLDDEGRFCTATVQEDHSWSCPIGDFTLAVDQQFSAFVLADTNNNDMLDEDDTAGPSCDLVRVTLRPSSSSHPASVYLSAPTGGETMTAGSVTLVTWSSSGSTVSAYRLCYSVDGGTNWVCNADVAGNPGTYGWTVPASATTHGRVRVELLSGSSVLATASNMVEFSIVMPSSGGSSGGTGGTIPPPASNIGSSGQDGVSVGGVTRSSAVAREVANASLPPAFQVDSLVKLANDNNPNTDLDSTVYYIGLDAKRHPFMSTAAYMTWYPDFSLVTTIPSSVLSSIPLGAPIMVRPGTKWVKIVSDPKVYFVGEGNTLRWVKDEATAAMLGGADWASRVIDVDPTMFMYYTMGTDLTVASLTASWPAGSLVRCGGASAPVEYVTATSRRPFSGTGFASNFFRDEFVTMTDASAGCASLPVGSAIALQEDGLFSLMH